MAEVVKVVQLKEPGTDVPVAPVTTVDALYNKNGDKVDNLLSYTVLGNDSTIPEMTENVEVIIGAHTQSAESINSGTLAADRLPSIPEAKLPVRPVTGGGTGGTTAAEARTNLDVYSKSDILDDTVCTMLGIQTTSAPKDAFLAILAVLGISLLRVTAKHADGTPYAGLQINGITGIDPTRCITNDSGILNLYVSDGSYTLESAESDTFIDAAMAPVTVVVAAGESKDVLLQETTKSATSVEIKTTQNIVFSKNVSSVDAFCVGGGGGGYSSASGGGGGGGYTTTALNIDITPGMVYPAVIGAGGLADNNGGVTSIFGYSASGGYSGSSYNGGNGGSGGGCGNSTGIARDGGSDGGDGGTYSSNIGGAGQGLTTKAFGEESGVPFSGGGGGGSQGINGTTGGYFGGGNGATHWSEGSTAPVPGVANSGGGGGGGGAAGGSGIIIIRWRFN